MVQTNPYGKASLMSTPGTSIFLREWRKHRGITQEALAERVGMTAPTISQLENEKQGWTGDTISKLADALQCSPAALLAHNPNDPDSLWPLFETANRLRGPNRQKIRAILKVALDQFS